MKEKINTILNTIDVIKKKYGKQFYLMVGRGNGAAIRGEHINDPDLEDGRMISFGIDYIENNNVEQLKAITIHESFHNIFSDLNQFGIPSPWKINPLYWESEIKTWKRVRKEFPKLTKICDKFIEYDLKVIKTLKK